MSTVGWVSDPNGRGTAGLVLSCVLTLGLCVWSALHLNIPPKGESSRAYWSRNIRWVLLGVFIPELVILSAWRQWASARELHLEMLRILDGDEDGLYGGEKTKSNDSSYLEIANRKGVAQATVTGLPSRTSTWTYLHDFYASMGGFVFDLEDEKGASQIFPEIKHRCLVLTPKGVLLLARCGHLPEIKSRDIKDKSKADGIAKALVVLQASWMVVQTLGRVAQGLPVSLLEVNTVAHVFCAFVVYVLWWKKPREVREPTVLTGDWAGQLAAFMYMSSRISGAEAHSLLPSRMACIPELSRYDYIEPREPSQESENLGAEAGVLRNDGKLPDVGIAKATPLHLYTSAGPFGSFVLRPDLDPVHSNLSSTNLKAQQARFLLAAEAIQRFPAIRERFTRHEALDTIGPSRLTSPAEQLVVEYAPNWISDYFLPGLQGEVMGMALWFASMAYGGIHLAAWHDQFPSEAETLLWRFSAIFISSSGLFWFLLNVMAHYSPWASAWWDRFYGRKSHILQYILLGSGATVCGLSYIFSRVFLVVEGLASLRQAPTAIYDTPDWSVIVPHL